MITDRKIPKFDTVNSTFADYYDPVVLSATDYFPFGMEMPGRTIASNGYRFGFNGKEKDTEGEWGTQTHYDYGFRIYEPGIGRFLSVDPLMKEYPELTPYQFASNSPVAGVDLDGLEFALKTKKGRTEWHAHFHVILESAQINYSQARLLMNQTVIQFGETFSGKTTSGVKLSAVLTFDFIDATQVKAGDYYLTLTDRDFGHAGLAIGHHAYIGIYKEMGDDWLVNDVGSEEPNWILNPQPIAETIVHEIGHIAGLPHPWMPFGQVKDVWNARMSILESFYKNIEAGMSVEEASNRDLYKALEGFDILEKT